MNTEEKIKVMQAYAEGKQIEIYIKGIWKDWAQDYAPTWNWDSYKYRIKLEATYRPYKDTYEMVTDYKERFKVDVPQYAMPLIWVKDKSNGDIKFIEGYTTILVYVFSGWWSLKVLYEGFTYLDGSPVGKLVEE